MIRTALRIASYIWMPVLLLIAWWVSSAPGTIFFFPPLENILGRFQANFLSPNVTVTLLPSLLNLLLGFLLAAVIGTVGGLLLGLSRRVSAFVAPGVHFFRSLPGPALLPLFMLLLGIGMSMKVWVIAFTAIFPILLNTIDGVRSREPRWEDVCSAYHLSPVRRLLFVIFPGAMPQIMTGLRVGLQTSLLLMVVSEMLASTGGVGFLILQSQQQFRIADMWAGILMLGLLGFVLNALFDPVERSLLRWYNATHDTRTA